MEKTDIVLCNSSFDRQKMFYFWRPTLIMHPTTTEGEIMKSLHICLTDSILLMPYTFDVPCFKESIAIVRSKIPPIHCRQRRPLCECMPTELAEGGKRERERRAWWAPRSRLDNQCNANCQGGKMSIGGGGGGGATTRVVKGPTPSRGRARPPSLPPSPLS